MRNQILSLLALLGALTLPTQTWAWGESPEDLQFQIAMSQSGGFNFNSTPTGQMQNQVLDAYVMAIAQQMNWGGSYSVGAGAYVPPIGLPSLLNNYSFDRTLGQSIPY